MGPLERLRARLDDINKEIRGINDAAEAEKRDALTADEETKYAELREQRTQVEARIAQLEDEEKRRAASDAGHVRTGQTGEGGRYEVAGRDLVYSRDSLNSYFRDLIASTQPGSEEHYDAAERLQRHAEMLARVPDKDIPKAFRGGPTKRAAGTARNGRDVSPEARTNPSRIGGQGGYFVPPVWLIDEFVPYLRAGRVLADRFEQMDLPAGTDVINVPKLTLGTITGIQQDNNQVPSQDITDTFVSAPVRTIAGQEDVALQLLEQSPVGAGFDQIMLKDLLASYNQQLDLQCISGTGANGQLKGVLNISGINAITYTSASPTLIEMYPYFGKSMSQIARQRFQMPTAVVMTPQRWFWAATGLDGSNRPLILPSSSPAFNAMGRFEPNAEGLVGEILGVPIFVDANVPSNLGAGTNQDIVVEAKYDDLYLYEGAIRTRVLVEVLSGTLQVRVQLYNYVAALVDRFAVSVATIGGTGTISPTGF